MVAHKVPSANRRAPFRSPRFDFTLRQANQQAAGIRMQASATGRISLALPGTGLSPREGHGSTIRKLTFPRRA